MKLMQRTSGCSPSGGSSCLPTRCDFPKVIRSQVRIPLRLPDRKSFRHRAKRLGRPCDGERWAHATCPNIVPAGPQDLGDVLVATSFIRRGAPEGVRPPGEPPGIVSRVGLTLVIIRVSCGTTARSDLLIRWLWRASDLAAGHMAASLELSVMAKDPVDATLARFSRWAGKTTRELSGDPGVNVGELRLLLDLMRNHLGIDDPADLGRGDIEELLLSVYPRKVTVMDREDTGGHGPCDAGPARLPRGDGGGSGPGRQAAGRRAGRGGPALCGRGHGPGALGDGQ